MPRKQRLLGDLAQGNRRHGLSQDLIAGMVAQQLGLCAICRGPLPAIPTVDHDHELEALHGHPGRGCPRCVRGLLCEHCNKLLGFSRDSVAILLRAVAYLTEWRQRRDRT